MAREPREAMSRQDYEALSEFRYQLRKFLRFSDEAARAEQLTPLQYQLMLQVRGFAGREWAAVGELAERLQIQPHGAVALVSRCEQKGLVERRQNQDDRRVMEVHLLPAGARILERLADRHKQQLRTLRDTFQVAHISQDDPV